MKEKPFKAWLEEGGAKTEAGRNTRTYAIRTIENKLAALGSPHADLDDAWKADRFEQLRGRLKELREDFAAGGSDHRVLMPESDNPYKRLSAWRSWLSQYGQFLSGEPRGQRDADRIRQYVLEHYIEAARERDTETVDVLVREVNETLGLKQAWPNICQAVTGLRFQEMADVEPPERIGADQSSATVFRFRVGAAVNTNVYVGGARPFVLFDATKRAFKPVLHHNRQTGRSAYRIKPPGASNKADEAVEVYTMAEVARAMLIDGRPARVQSLHGGPVNYVAYGKQKLVRYELDPEIAKEIGVPPRGEVAQPTALDRDALEQLRGLFLEKHPDFRTFDDSGSFGPGEDEYKRALVERADGLMSEHAGADERILGAALLDLISGKGGLESNLLGWRMVDGLAKSRLAYGIAIETAAGRLARDADPIFGLTSFVTECWPLFSEGQEQSLPYGDSRTIPTMLRALVDPERIMAIRSRPTDNASTMLRGHRVLTKQLDANQIESVMTMAREIFAVMRDEWRWRPRDFWDVQGFIWETCQETLSAPSERPAAQPETEQHMAQSTNLILYGPPGTGKTYSAAAEAVRLCGEPVPEGREALMTTYRRLAEAGRIEFVTFHQSISYEDFVEGLRPTQGSEDGIAGFELRPQHGIFRRLVRRAETSTGPGDFSLPISGRQIFKMSIGEAANPEDSHLFEEAIAGGYTLLGFEDIDWSDGRFADRSSIIEAVRTQGVTRGGEPNAMSGRVQMPFIFRNDMKLRDIVVVSKGNGQFRAIGEVTGDYQFVPREGGHYCHRRAVRWLWVDRAGVSVNEIYARSFMQKSIYLLTGTDLNVPALERYIASQQDTGTGTPEQFVLIIDEINRANISKVLGELITLLEPDKRVGQPNGLKVRLPYSGDVFGVPTNLHIIGTMNTADRSIALLDTALRRRFEFRELMPDASLLGVVDGIDLGKLLATINERIEYLFDREHQIGHAYFLSCTNRAELDEVMRHKVIPLLTEYFYEDWAKVATVLGDGKEGEGDHEGCFVDRRQLQTPKGMGGDQDAALRYRWSVRDTFSYHGIQAG